MLEIQLTRRGPAPIDVKQGGQFIEPLCDMIPSMIAQQVAGDSFEEELPWRFAFRAAIDKPWRPWYPCGAVHVAEYTLDTEHPFNGQRSQRINVSAPHACAGIAQDGFYTVEGVGYRLAAHMRSTHDVEVFAALHGGGGTVAGPVSLGRAGRAWHKAEAALRAVGTFENCTLSITFAGPGTLWLDRVYLIGEDAVLGIWRADVVAALRELNPGVIRYGGSALEAMGGLEWQDCVGPWDRRQPIPIPYWGGLDPNFASVEEIVQLCRHIGAEPLICIRWTDRTPADAAAQVEYFNGGPDTRMGRRRADNGHRAPYGVKYWQIGNEVAGEEYEQSLGAFARAMKQRDPSILTIASTTTPKTLALAGETVDYVCDHHYAIDDLVRTAEGLRFLAEQAGQTARPVRAAITEWNTTAAEWGLKRGALATLRNGLRCARYHHLLQRHADVVEISVRSNLADSFCSGVIQPGPGRFYLTPTYYVQQLYARAAGSHPLALHDDRDASWPQVEPDVSATLSADGRVLRIYAVNSTTERITVPLRLVDTQAAVTKAALHVVRDRDGAPTAEVLNDRHDPQRIATVTQAVDVRGREFEQTFDALSVSLLELILGD